MLDKYKYEVWKSTIGTQGESFGLLAKRFKTLKEAREYKVFAKKMSPKHDYYRIWFGTKPVS